MMAWIFGFTRASAIDNMNAANAATQYRGQEQANKINDKHFKTLFQEHTEQWGTIKVQTWPEGLVVWVGGEIVYRSWKK